MILHIPIIDPLNKTFTMMAGDQVRCSLHRDCPRVEVNGATLKPDLMTWAQQQAKDHTSALYRELEARDLLNLSELTEGPYQTVKALAWSDLKRVVEGLR